MSMSDASGERGANYFDDAFGVGGTEGSGAGDEGVVDRRAGVDRRARGEDETGLERRRGPGRRLNDQLRAAEEGELTKEQFLFVMAIEAFKKANGKSFPTWTDVLEVVRLLGYRKTMPMEVHLPSAEDWQESYNAGSGVRSPRWARHCKVDAERRAAG